MKDSAKVARRRTLSRRISAMLTCTMAAGLISAGCHINAVHAIADGIDQEDPLLAANMDGPIRRRLVNSRNRNGSSSEKQNTKKQKKKQEAANDILKTLLDLESISSNEDRSNNQEQAISRPQDSNLKGSKYHAEVTTLDFNSDYYNGDYKHNDGDVQNTRKEPTATTKQNVNTKVKNVSGSRSRSGSTAVDDLDMMSSGAHQKKIVSIQKSPKYDGTLNISGTMDITYSSTEGALSIFRLTASGLDPECLQLRSNGPIESNSRVSTQKNEKTVHSNRPGGSKAQQEEGGQCLCGYCVEDCEMHGENCHDSCVFVGHGYPKPYALYLKLKPGAPDIAEMTVSFKKNKCATNVTKDENGLFQIVKPKQCADENKPGLGTEVYLNYGDQSSFIHTSCSDELYPGMIIEGSSLMIEGYCLDEDLNSCSHMDTNSTVCQIEPQNEVSPTLPTMAPDTGTSSEEGDSHCLCGYCVEDCELFAKDSQDYAYCHDSCVFVGHGFARPHTLYLKLMSSAPDITEMTVSFKKNECATNVTKDENGLFQIVKPEQCIDESKPGLGTEVYLNYGDQSSSIHTSCSVELYPGMIIEGSPFVIEGYCLDEDMCSHMDSDLHLCYASPTVSPTSAPTSAPTSSPSTHPTSSPTSSPTPEQKTSVFPLVFDQPARTPLRFDQPDDWGSPEFDPKDTLTTYSSGNCGPRGHDAEADLSQCEYGSVIVAERLKGSETNPVVAKVDECLYFRYSVYRCISHSESDRRILLKNSFDPTCAVVVAGGSCEKPRGQDFIVGRATDEVIEVYDDSYDTGRLDGKIVLVHDYNGDVAGCGEVVDAPAPENCLCGFKDTCDDLPSQNCNKYDQCRYTGNLGTRPHTIFLKLDPPDYLLTEIRVLFGLCEATVAKDGNDLFRISRPEECDDGEIGTGNKVSIDFEGDSNPDFVIDTSCSSRLSAGMLFHNNFMLEGYCMNGDEASCFHISAANPES